MKNQIVGMGEALWDLLPEGAKVGGAPANFAFHMSQFGYHAFAVSAVGKDELGRNLLDKFAEKGLKTLIPQVGFPTGTVQVTLDEQGVPQYEITGNVAWDNVPFTEQLAQVAVGTQCVCFGSLAQRSETTRLTINRFLDLMPKNALKVFDINLRQQFYSEEVLRESMQRCNILKINDEEALVVSHLFHYELDDLPAVCLRLKSEYALDTVILTCGVNGSYVFYDKGYSFLYTPRVTVADTVGAGDSFTAGFCASRLCGKSIPEAHAVAVETSAFVCTQQGAMPPLPQEILDRLR